MKCPHLNKWVVFTCKATDTLYFPSAFQLEAYCKTKEHRRCPFFATTLPQENLEDVIHLAST